MSNVDGADRQEETIGLIVSHLQEILWIVLHKVSQAMKSEHATASEISAWVSALETNRSPFIG